MKRFSLFASAVLVAGASFAASVDVTDTLCLGVIPVTSSNSEVVISVPWVEVGASSTNCISVTNFVLATGLTAGGLETGDKLIWYGGEASPKSWYLKTGSPLPFWKACTDGSVDAPNPDFPAIKQGQALILTRHSPTNTDGTAKTFYLVGQVGTNTTVRTTVAANGYTLVAPPAKQQINFNNTDHVAAVSGAYAKGDTIYVEVVNGIRRMLKYDGEKWLPSWTPRTVENATIDVGRGFWYYRKGDSSLTLEWKSGIVPHM